MAGARHVTTKTRRTCTTNPSASLCWMYGLLRVTCGWRVVLCTKWTRSGWLAGWWIAWLHTHERGCSVVACGLLAVELPEALQSNCKARAWIRGTTTARAKARHGKGKQRTGTSNEEASVCHNVYVTLCNLRLVHGMGDKKTRRSCTANPSASI